MGKDTDEEIKTSDLSNDELELLAILCAWGIFRAYRIEVCTTHLPIIQRLKISFGGTYHHNRLKSYNYHLMGKNKIATVRALIKKHYPKYAYL